MKKLLTTALVLFSLLSSIQAEELKGHLAKMSITDTKGVSYEVQGTEEGMIFKGLEGRVVFLEFFGHKCPPCLASIPHLKKLQEKHKDKLTIIAVEVQNQTEKELKAFVKEHKINYITVAGSKADEFIQYIAQRAEWRGSIPFTIGMNTKGDVQLVEVGMLPDSLLEEQIKKLSKVETKTEVKTETKVEVKADVKTK